MSFLVDTHAHLTHERFGEDWVQALAAAEEAGVGWVIDVADDLTSAVAAAERAGCVSRLSATAGVHPHHASQWGTEEMQQLSQLLHLPQVVAVGEIGLDYYYDFAPKQRQLIAFRDQMQMAQENQMPVVVHARDADDDVLALLAEFAPVRGVWHCFWSDRTALDRALELGMFIGVGGPLTFGNTVPLREVLRHTPIDRILLETDSPYLAPVPHRGKRNEPAFVSYVAQALADLQEVPLAKVVEQTCKNAMNLFRISNCKHGQ